MMIYALLIIGLMLVRPQGLFSWKRATTPAAKST